MSPFTEFTCSPKYRLYDNDAAIDYDVTFDTTLNIYKVRQEYDLRFFCTWSNLGNFLQFFEFHK